MNLKRAILIIASIFAVALISIGLVFLVPEPGAFVFFCAGIAFIGWLDNRIPK